MVGADALVAVEYNNKRGPDYVDDLDNRSHSPKRAKLTEDLHEEPQIFSGEMVVEPRIETLLDSANNERSDTLAFPSNSVEFNHTRETTQDTTTSENTATSDTQKDCDSSGLSSPLSYSTDDMSLSDPVAHGQGSALSGAEASDLDSPSLGDIAMDLDDTYTAVKVSRRARKRPEVFGGLVPTAFVIEEEDILDLDFSSGPPQKKTKVLVAPRKKTTTQAVTKQASQRQTIENARETWKEEASAQEETSKMEKKLLSSLRTSVKRAKSSQKAGMPTKVSKARLSKAEEKSQLRRLAAASSLARWSMQNAARAQTKKDAPLIVTVPLPELDLDLLALSKRMTYRESLADKPEPFGRPEVWAESRQALCETLPYFKSPQSGSYQNDSHVYGFLFDSIGHCREYMDEDIIICRAGGSMEADGAGGMVQKKDHSMTEAQVQAVLNDMAHHNPVVVICGDRNLAAPCKMPHQYCVLGWYKLTLVWSEKTAGKCGKVWTTIKYRLERLNNHVRPWHAPKGSSPPVEALSEVPIKRCNECYTEFPQIYLGGWMCLNSKCGRFWMFHGAIDAPYGNEQSLSYHPAFLSYRSAPWTADGGKWEVEPAPLKTPVPNVGSAIGDNLTHINTRGICCPKCGRCNSRRLFKGWICENPDCDFELSAMHQPVSPAMLHTPWDLAQTLVRNRKAPTVSLNVVHMHGYKLSIYTFHGIAGSLIHASATKPVIEQENGPNDMIANMQITWASNAVFFAMKKKASDTREKIAAPYADAELGTPALERDEDTQLGPNAVVADSTALDPKPIFAEGDLMTAFSMNYGMPYKFVASGGSKPFEAGPWPIPEARRRLNWAAKTFLNDPEKDMDLNELLVFAYLESQKLEYHDDGEEGLGPRIATLSLGGKAKMHMRMKSKFYIGCSKTGILVEEKPVAGSIEYEKRLQAWTELQRIKQTDPATYTKRRKAIPKELNLYEKRMKKAEDLVTITLCHGDIVIMDGYDVQKYLEHKVVSEGYLRFALTCRTVLENHLKLGERPGYEVRIDEKTYDGLKM